MAQPRAKILLVDDRPHDGELAALVLRSELGEVDVVLVADALAFSERLAEGGFDLAITERRLGWGDGAQVLAAVQRRCLGCPVMFFTTFGDPGAAFEAAKLSAEAYVVKGSAGYLQLPVTVRQILARSAAATGARTGPDSLLERLPVGLFRLDPAARLSCRNPACRSLFRLPEGAQGYCLLDRFADAAARQRFATLLDAGAGFTDFDTRLAVEAGEPVWVRIHVWPDTTASAPMFEGMAFDITAYRQALSKLSRNAEELGRSNAELERFAYVASHDLQEPLSYISRYARLFSDRYQGELDEDGGRYLGHILDSSRRLQSMVDDILAYSRVGTRGASFEPVDFAAALDAAAAGLERAFQDTGAMLEHGPLPTLDADGRQIEQLFQNLLSNALKFKGPEPPRIQVTAQELEDAWRFSVSDNGIGLDPEASERIFGMFQRLHTSDEYPGTGIGLAICRSIVDRHGGRIWVESAPGRGATFHFTIGRSASLALPGEGDI